MFNNLFCIYTNADSMTEAKLARFKNNIALTNEFMRNVHDGLARYHMEGLPSTISERVVLQSLFLYASVFFYEKAGNLLALPGAPDGSGMNVNGDFGGAYVYGANGYNERIDVFLPGSDESAFLAKTIGGKGKVTAKGVMVRENAMLYPFVNYAITYAERQADTFRKMEVAQLNSAVPYVIKCDKSEVPTVKKALKDRAENMIAIIGENPLSSKDIDLLPFDITSDAIRTQSEAYDWYCSHYRELCGVKNCTNIDKKGANMTQGEVNINDEYTGGQLDKTISSIQKGLDDVNKLFGTNIRVVPNNQGQETLTEKDEEGEEEDDVRDVSE